MGQHTGESVTEGVEIYPVTTLILDGDAASLQILRQCFCVGTAKGEPTSGRTASLRLGEAEGLSQRKNERDMKLPPFCGQRARNIPKGTDHRAKDQTQLHRGVQTRGARLSGEHWPVPEGGCRSFWRDHEQSADVATPGAGAVTAVAVGCSAWLGVAVIWLEVGKGFLCFGGRDAVTGIKVEASLEILLEGNPLTLVFDGARPCTNGDETGDLLSECFGLPGGAANQKGQEHENCDPDKSVGNQVDEWGWLIDKHRNEKATQGQKHREDVSCARAREPRGQRDW